MINYFIRDINYDTVAFLGIMTAFVLTEYSQLKINFDCDKILTDYSRLQNARSATGHRIRKLL